MLIIGVIRIVCLLIGVSASYSCYRCAVDAVNPIIIPFKMFVMLHNLNPMSFTLDHGDPNFLRYDGSQTYILFPFWQMSSYRRWLKKIHTEQTRQDYVNRKYKFLKQLKSDIEKEVSQGGDS